MRRDGDGERREKVGRDKIRQMRGEVVERRAWKGMERSREKMEGEERGGKRETDGE